MRCAYVVSRYPYVSHTFILREVQGLRARGIDIRTVTVRRPSEKDVICPTDREELRSTHAILPTSAGRVLGPHLRALLSAPLAYLRTLREAVTDASPGLRTGVWQLFYFAEAIMLWNWLEQRGISHVHAHHANVAADLAMIATRFGNRSGAELTWSFTIHGPTEFANVTAHKLGLKAARADSVVATSDFARTQILALLDPHHHERVEVVHGGIEAADYEPAAPGASGGSPLRVLSVGRLEARKGHAILLEAIAELTAREANVRLTLVGDGPERPHLERLARELGLTGAVRFVGALGHDKVTRVYQEADAFCMPSFAEGVPTVLMEAMASGLPVVATRIAGTPELITEDETGLLVTPGRADELASALARLAEDPELRLRLAAAGRRQVSEEWSIEKSCAALEDLFRRIAGDRDNGAAPRR